MSIINKAQNIFKLPVDIVTKKTYKNFGRFHITFRWYIKWFINKILNIAKRDQRSTLTPEKCGNKSELSDFRRKLGNFPGASVSSKCFTVRANLLRIVKINPYWPKVTVLITFYKNAVWFSVISSFMMKCDTLYICRPVNWC